ncbi:MAG: selenocysteine-specific translation elongation factor [Betaproteobacteria bacterium]|nr:selenocysteine-specific translation elongation factor [Betaproteobacteria bacterium]MDH5221277.1 selenocysteine-specific translation elongation factor [Betaproteobacteria bacterium]MDH5350318.1 selenocysteine-specific translation elongation factor [Betaproteobacteria bacterium]
MIVATAGHIDHGKTLLVKALTGVDGDRLPEEKRRGMTIDLGFAYLADAARSIGFIDVPGHERFIRNMLCGVTGVDCALLVVAADDGPMPQTFEHLAILDLLGVRTGLVALTKTDRVTPERAAAVRREIEALLSGTSLAGVSIHPVSAATGAGVEALGHALRAIAASLPRRAGNGNFRLAVDRAFSIAGAGLVVTGTVFSGRVADGDAVRVLRDGREARVRGIRAQHARADAGRAGERCALNLTGTRLKAEHLQRGDWIVSGTLPAPTSRLDARVRVLRSEARALRHWTPVHVHLGAAESSGRIAVLEGAAIAPGANALVRVALERPMGAVYGDRLVLRDQSARRTIGGGHVIDGAPPARGRARQERIEMLRALDDADPARALQACLAVAARAGKQGVNLAQFAAGRNLTHAEAQALFARVAMRRVDAGAMQVAFHDAHWAALRKHAAESVAEWLRHTPDAPGAPEDRLLGRAEHAPEVTAALATELVDAGVLARAGAHLRLPAHRPAFSGADEALWQRLAALLDPEDGRPPAIGDLAARVEHPPQAVLGLLERAARNGYAVRVSESRFFLPRALLRLASVAEQVASTLPEKRFTAAQFRNATALGRNLSIEVLEYFDRMRFTRRVGDARMVVRPAAQLLAGSAQAVR